MARDKKAQGVAIVTGAAGGMGSQCARLIAEDGWPELLLCDLEASRLEAVAEPLRRNGAAVAILAGDITDADFFDKMLAMVGTREIGAVIHTAGVSPGMTDRDRLLEVNLDGSQRLVDAIRGRMAEGSAAVLFASIAGHFPTTPDLDALFEQPLPPDGTRTLRDQVPSTDAAYSLSKRAVTAMAKREARAFGERNARIVSISPGTIDTPMMDVERNEGTEALLEMAAIHRLGRPEELAEVAAFLCSSRASFITGTDIIVDGGAIAGMGNAVTSAIELWEK